MKKVKKLIEKTKAKHNKLIEIEKKIKKSTVLEKQNLLKEIEKYMFLDQEEKNLLKELLEIEIEEEIKNFTNNLNELIEKNNIRISGNYPNFLIKIGTNELKLQIVCPNKEVKLEETRIQNATPQKIATEIKNFKKIIDKSKNIGYNDKEWINLFKKVHEIVSLIKKEESTVEIKGFIALSNYIILQSGYKSDLKQVQDKFVNLFLKLGLIPISGRDTNKQVQIKDEYGNAESFMRLKLKK